jgi:hypothetical protein
MALLFNFWRNFTSTKRTSKHTCLKDLPGHYKQVSENTQLLQFIAGLSSYRRSYQLSTAYHAKYFAHELTRHTANDGVDRLSMALFDASVDLNQAIPFAMHVMLCERVIHAVASEILLEVSHDGL